jgi:hypothetical protein
MVKNRWLCLHREDLKSQCTDKGLPEKGWRQVGCDAFRTLADDDEETLLIATQVLAQPSLRRRGGLGKFTSGGPSCSEEESGRQLRPKAKRLGWLPPREFGKLLVDGIEESLPGLAPEQRAWLRRLVTRAAQSSTRGCKLKLKAKQMLTRVTRCKLRPLQKGWQASSLHEQDDFGWAP